MWSRLTSEKGELADKLFHLYSYLGWLLGDVGFLLKAYSQPVHLMLDAALALFALSLFLLGYSFPGIVLLNKMLLSMRGLPDLFSEKSGLTWL